MKKAEKIAIKLRDKLSEYNDFIGLYLYGSQISGKAKKDSDIDIVGIFKNNKDFDSSISMKILDLDLEFNVVVDFQRMTLSCLKKTLYILMKLKREFIMQDKSIIKNWLLKSDESYKEAELNIKMNFINEIKKIL